jgi:hypothetical protein
LELWVLEMHVRRPDRRFGAFFEDLLVEDDAIQALAFTQAPALPTDLGVRRS